MRDYLLALLLAFLAVPAFADEYDDALKTFRDAGQSGRLFAKSYGYAVFPTVGKGGIGVGAAHGNGRVYAKGKHVGDTSMTQITVGAQLGGQAYSQIVFFEDRRAFDEFTGGNFEFGAQATAVAITAGAAAQAGSTGATASASTSSSKAKTSGEYHKGMAVFGVVKGGLMYEASVGGQKFSFTPKK
jgi:lipid-binding SYLF domain-containing protein